MGIDPTDNRRDEIRRDEAKRLESQRESKRISQNKDVASKNASAQFQSALQAKSKKDKTLLDQDRNQMDEHSGGSDKKEEKNLFHRIIEVFRDEEKKQEGRKEKVRAEKSDNDEADDDVQENKDSTSSTGVSQDSDHVRIDRLSDQQGGAEGQSSGGSGSQSSDTSSSNQENSDSSQGQPNLGHKKVTRVSSSAGVSVNKGFSGKLAQLTNQDLDAIVASVTLGVNRGGNTEMALTLSDEFFSGVRLVFTKEEKGITILIRCPNSKVRNIFLTQRIALYERLKHKNVNINRIDIEV